MAHEITEHDGLFTVRKPAWHGLGTVLPDHPTREEAQRIAHPWEPIAEPVYRKTVSWERHVCTPTCPEQCDIVDDFRETYEVVEDAKLNVRSDNGYPLGVVSSTFTTVNNSVMYDVAEAIEGMDPTEVKYETGGSLKGGRKVWLLLRLAEPIVVKGDPNGAVLPYYALQNAHDGSGSFRGQAVTTRIVCANTAHIADLDAKARGTEFVFSHTRNVAGRIEDAKKALEGWRSAVKSFEDEMHYLRSLGVTDSGREQFIQKFIPMPAAEVASDRVRRNVDDAQGILRRILDGPTCEGIKGSSYGLVQASIEYLNHGRRSHSEASAFKRSYLDRSDIIPKATRLAIMASANA